ncbi:tripartite tricarboxylate transporter substrate binding protein [Xylophilus rhododendri]|uniref:Tripartite tricarboxylate transporter substrate binding protein n=1 Tax=Xylophilus rhododendri TaxID=2697032 RepID=A0A857J9H6_9BURK|nr:tripartite tricarboxylate transporter substrate binding protein [Xylophilus rhododendri]QHJ00645.1 tripartite tricarboxylate transporter substrate binding protein [Xylophilus rhododendri]
MFKLSFLRSCLAAALASAALLPAAHAQNDYPSKPIRIVVGYPAGGSVDIAARILADGLGPRLHAAIVVDNLGGAAGAIAAQKVAGSAPDGYTLLVGANNELAATGTVNPAQKYDPEKDFTPVGLAVTAPVLLVAGPKAGVKTLDEFVEAVRRKPGQYSYGSSGVGSILHFAGELIKQRAGIFMTHIPYRGTAPLLSDLAGGNIEFAMISPAAAAPFIRSGRITALGISSPQRSPAMPGVPALAEHPRLKGYEMIGWFALVGPRGLPPEVNARLAAALQATLQDPAIRKRLDEASMVPASGREDVAAMIRADVAQYRKLVDFAHIRD